MSYIYNNQIKYSDSPNLDAFGRLRVSEITSLLEVTNTVDNLTANSFLSYITEGGSAGTTWDPNLAKIGLDVGTGGDLVITYTRQSAPYQPGKGQLFESSFSNFQIETDVTKRIGCFTSIDVSQYESDLDGFFLESNGTTNEIYFQIHRKGNLVFSSPSSSWYNSEIDVNTIDWSKTNLMLVDFQWLGVGRVRFGLSLSGNTYIFTESNGTNNLTDVYMSNPNKPIRHEIRSTGGAGTLNQICSQVSMEGSLNSLIVPFATSNQNLVTLSTASTKYAVMGFSMSSGYEHISPILRKVDILNTSNDNYIVTLEINPSISGSYTFTADTITGVNYSFGDGSQTVTGSGITLGSFIGEAGSQANSSFELFDSKIKPGRDIDGTLDEVWVCITPLGANATFYTSANLYYYS